MAPIRVVSLLVLTAAVVLGATLSPTAVAQEGAGPRHSVRGTVLGPDGRPVAGVLVRALDVGDPAATPWQGSTTDSRGVFRVRVPDGSYGLEFYRDLGDGDCILMPATVGVAVSGAAMTIPTVTLPVPVSEACRRVQGVLTDTGHEPLAGHTVGLHWPDRPWRASARGTTAADGTFTFYIHDGTHAVFVTTAAGNGCTLSRDGTVEGSLKGRVVVDGEAVTGLRVVVSREPSPSPQQLTCSLGPEVLTRELQPGWNPAGWTGYDADPSALFQAIPPLKAAYAWDATRQQFRSVTRSGTGFSGDLETLTPGMGLWLQVGGTAGVPWSPPLLPQSLFVSLHEGWNLVAWGGRDGASPERALAFLGDDLAAAAVWRAEDLRFRVYVPHVPAAATTLRRLNRGEAVWLNLKTERRWLQPGAATPTFNLPREMSTERKESFFQRVEDVMAYFAERYGEFVPGLTISVGDFPGVCGEYDAPTIRLSEGCLRAVAHEYAHAVQHHIATGGSPAWLVEGVANRWSAQYYDYSGDRTYEEHMARIVRPASSLVYRPLDEMEHYDGLLAEGARGYSFVHMAVDWLARLPGGEDALFDYFDQRSGKEDWRDTFRATFGMSAKDFYAAFATYFAEGAGLPYRIEGVVLGPADEPLDGIAVRAWGRPGELDQGPWTGRLTGADGAFSIYVPEGSYTFEPYVELESGRCTLGRYSGHGELHELGPLPVAVDVADMQAVTLKLARDPSRSCTSITVTVVDPTGEPLGQYLIWVVRRGELGSEAIRFRTAADGTFSTIRPNGAYSLSLATTGGGSCVFSGYPATDDTIIADGEPIALRIVVSGTPRASESFFCTSAE